MKSIVLICATAATTLFVVPSSAVARTVPEPAPQVQQNAPVKAAPRRTLYCLMHRDSGARFAQTTCRTRVDWNVRGIEVEAAR